MSASKMSETQAVMAVLQGEHPGNCVKASVIFSKNIASKEFSQFISNDVPDHWHVFRRVCHLLWMEAKCLDDAYDSPVKEI